MYKYFISFSHMTKGVLGFGCTETLVDHKITGMDEIGELMESLEDEFGLESVVIINFVLLEVVQ